MRPIAAYVLTVLLSFLVSAANADETALAAVTKPGDRQRDPGQSTTPLLRTGVAVEVLRRFPEAILSCEHGGQYGEPFVNSDKVIQFDSAPASGSRGCSIFLIRRSLGFFQGNNDLISKRIKDNWDYLSGNNLVNTLSIVGYVVEHTDSVPCREQAASDDHGDCSQLSSQLSISSTDDDEAIVVLDTSKLTTGLFRKKINAKGIELVDVDNIASFPIAVQARLRKVLQKPGDRATVVTINWFFAEKPAGEEMLTRY